MKTIWKSDCSFSSYLKACLFLSKGCPSEQRICDWNMFPYWKRALFLEKEFPSRALRVEDAYLRDQKRQGHMLRNGLTLPRTLFTPVLGPKVWIGAGWCSFFSSSVPRAALWTMALLAVRNTEFSTWRTLIWWGTKRLHGVVERLSDLKAERQGFTVPALSLINHEILVKSYHLPQSQILHL